MSNISLIVAVVTATVVIATHYFLVLQYSVHPNKMIRYVSLSHDIKKPIS